MQTIQILQILHRCFCKFPMIIYWWWRCIEILSKTNSRESFSWKTKRILEESFYFSKRSDLHNLEFDIVRQKKKILGIVNFSSISDEIHQISQRYFQLLWKICWILIILLKDSSYFKQKDCKCRMENASPYNELINNVNKDAKQVNVKIAFDY